MKTISVYFLQTIAVMMFVTSCSKEVHTPSVKEGLIGTWEWVGTDGGIANHIHKTPANTGKNVDLKITSDGKYSVYTNGVLTSNGTYVLSTRKCIHDHADKTLIDFSSDYDVMVERIDEENLEVSDEGFDGLGSGYKRKSTNGN